MGIIDLIDKVGAIIALGAIAGILLLLPLYLSQRRDVRRLRAWMEAEPEHPAADARASEAILDRAESELESLLGEPPPAAAAPAPAARKATPVPAVTAVQRVTGERPALERITMERAALQPHPRWRRFVARVTQPRWLIAIAIAALVLGVAAIFGSERLLERGDNEKAPRAGAVDPADVGVAILNGTSVPGLAANVGDDVEANGYDLGTVTTSPEPYEQSVVMFSRGEQRAAEKVAKDLGIRAVQQIDPRTRRLAEGADVVVIAGQERAAP